MNITEFISNLPTTTRDRNSEIKNAIDSGKIYISIINKNNKQHFKIYYKEYRENGAEIKIKQLKVSPVTIEYIKNNLAVIALSDTAKKVINE